MFLGQCWFATSYMLCCQRLPEALDIAVGVVFKASWAFPPDGMAETGCPYWLTARSVVPTGRHCGHPPGHLATLNKGLPGQSFALLFRVRPTPYAARLNPVQTQGSRPA